MRDVKRIKRITELLEKIWDHSPDLRFFQMLWALELQGKDMFYREDDDLEEYLKKSLENLEEKK